MIADEILKDCERFLRMHVPRGPLRERLRTRILDYLQEFGEAPVAAPKIELSDSDLNSLLRRLNRLANDQGSTKRQSEYFTKLYRRVQANNQIAQIVYRAIDGKLNRDVFGILSLDVNLHILAPELL